MGMNELGLKRCGKSCRLRWMNYLRPDVKRGYISPEEEDLILRLHRLLGNRWSLIAGRIPGRTDNEIKNYWNTHLKKKLLSQGIDPRTHKPLPQQSLLGENLPFTKPMPKSSEETESEQNNGVGQVQNQICRSEESELQKGQTQDLQDSSNQKQKTESQRTFHDDLSTVQTTHNNYSNILLSSLNCHQSPTIIPETAHHPKPLFKATTAAREYFNFNPTSNHHSTNIPFLLHDILPSSIPASDRGRFSSTLSPLGLTVNFCNSNNNDPVKQGYPFISMDQIQNPSHAAAAVAPDLMQQPFPGNENTVLPTVPRNMELQSGLFEGSGSRPWATATDQSCLQKWQRLQKAQGLTHEMTNLNTSMNTNMNLSSNGNVELNNSNNHGYGHQNGGLFVDVNNHSAHFPAISHQSTHLSHFGMDQESLNVSDPWLLSHCHPHL